MNLFIPQEYLALKINYCRQQLEKLPVVKLQMFKIRGTPTQRVVIGTRRFSMNTKQGKTCIDIMNNRECYEQQLGIWESVWNSRHKGEPLPECVPHKVLRKLYVNTGEYVVMNKAYFDSLKNDADTSYPKPRSYPFNGIFYRSAAERDIAIYYTKMGIPFKYEPEVYINGLTKPIYPDFVIYIVELDNCKFHEHFGIQQSEKYLRSTSFKYENYTKAGLIPELDILFTHDVDDMPFDIRAFASKLNTAVYTTAISTTVYQNIWEAAAVCPESVFGRS